MTTIFTRDKDGKVEVPELGTVTIPKDRLALSMLAYNPFIPGCEYREDSWIYNNAGEKVRKWFINIDRVVIWEPILADPSKLEKRFANAEKYAERHHQEWQQAYSALVKAGEADVKPTHKYKLYQNHTWWHYTSDRYDVSFDWTEEPKEPKNVEIGTRYYLAFQRLSKLNGSAYKFRTALLESLIRKIPRDLPPYLDMVEMKVNGKSYWLKYNKYSWDLFAYPGSMSYHSIEV